eukprot:COSAG04_NODE_320_length_16877_cov_26.485401_1_plen_4766_part_00
MESTRRGGSCLFCLSKGRDAGCSSGGSGSASAGTAHERAGLSELRRRATAAGATEEDIDAADDAVDPRSAMAALCAAHGGGAAGGASGRRAQLEMEKPSALKRRARALGAAEAEIEEAEDAEDRTAAMVELVLKHEPAAAQLPSPDDRGQALRAELDSAKPSELRKRAAAAGATEEEIDEADDVDDPKAALIALVLEREGARGDPMEALRSLKPSALRKRAAAAGVSGDEIEEAEDAEDPKAALIALILDAQPEAAPAAAEEASSALRSELQTLRRSALKIRAVEAGVDAEALAEADDAEDAKAKVISLILESQPGPDSTSEDMSALRSELQAMRVKALERRAVSEGVSAEAVEDAMDGDNPKGLLVDLIADAAASRGPADRLLSTLTTGGQSAADTLSAVLDQALDVLEQLSMSSPRKIRKSILELMESVEEAAESLEVSWCGGMSRCSADRLECLAGRVLAVQALTPDSADCVPVVSSLLESLRECGSVAVQCESVLAVDVGADETARLGALECVRGLSPASLGCVSDPEASLFDVLKNHLCGSERALSCEERLSCWLSLFVLGCRNGVAVVARVGVLEPLMEEMCVSMALLGTAAAASDDGAVDDELRVCSAAHMCTWVLVSYEAGPKGLPEARVGFEQCVERSLKLYLGESRKAFTASSFAKIIARVVELRLLEQESEDGVTVGCGIGNIFIHLGASYQWPLAKCDTEAVFGGVLTLLRRVCPSPLPAEWWVSTCAEVDVTSVQLSAAVSLFGSCAKQLDQATLESASWLSPALTEAVHICKVNASAGLSARPTMSFFAVAYALQLVEQAARVELHVASLLDSGVLEALDYACVNDFSYCGISVSNYAAGAVVALVGRNEGGKTLSRAAVAAVLNAFGTHFDPTHWRYSMGATARMLPVVRRVATMAIADANKKIMFQHDKLLTTLVAGLLLDDDNPRRGQDGADALQEACAGVLHELALYGPGALALRAHKPTMDALRVLAESGTKESRERATGALFELDEETRAAKAKAPGSQPSSAKPPPHIMVSYNWDHQHVILRVVAWLQAHGYLVWVDTEQMKGSTVDTMALAVEGSEVMLIGVSRAYKESSNCRMEAQYGLQKKKALIPLKLTQGYEADGWLGLLLGTSLWYALYGATLESESAFEDRMGALAREIGTRGRADAVVDNVPEPSPEPDDSSEPAALRAELQSMRLRALERRAVSEGVSSDDVDDAMDSDDPKASLVKVIVELSSKRGPADRLLSTLTTGGQSAADTLSAVLDQALDVLEQLSVSSPRKSRKSILELMDSVEQAAESLEVSWCGGMSRCSADRLGDLAARVLAVQALTSAKSAADSVPVVSSLLESLRDCGNVAVQCESVLAADSGSDKASRLDALECVRGLSPARLGSVSDPEASLFDALKPHLCGSERALTCAERLSCWLSLFVLGCRNGLSVVARVGVLEPLMEEVMSSVTLLGTAIASDDGAVDDELRVCSAAHTCAWVLVSHEGGPKSPPEARVEFEECMLRLMKTYFGKLAEALTADSFAKVLARIVALQLLEQESEEGLCVGCGIVWIIIHVAALYPKPFAECDINALFGGGLVLLRRVCPSPLPADWWLSTCAEVDVTSARLSPAVVLFGVLAKQLDQATLESASWLSSALTEAVHICKVNASAGLSARPTMSCVAVTYAFALAEQAARVESHAAALLDSGVLEALDYACANDFSYVGMSVSSYAAGAAVALVGRNEGGKTLSRAGVAAVLDAFGTHFDPTHWRSTLPATRLLPVVRRVATMAIADANKKAMIQHDTILHSLVAALVLDGDNPRRGQDGADALQEACAGVLHELALYGPGASALRAHTPTMDALRVLAESGTKESRERATGALFELDEETRAAKAKAPGSQPSSAKPPPHIMVSYNWDHQHVILRVVAWLQAHGYLVWVDTEQMKGSTVDTMALAVEGSEVMLIGVSRAYKESSNCRMEAQYGLQKKKALIPLKLTQGYEADGWLGLLLGTSLWYALYGSTLESESAFEDRMGALSRELGSRGRADAVVADAPEPCPESVESDTAAALRSELQSLRVVALQRRAASEGVSANAIEDAMDGDDPKASLIEMIVELASKRGPADRLLSTMTSGGDAAAAMLSAVLEHAMDVLEQVAMSSPRKSRKVVREMVESAEEVAESADEDWCDGLSRCGRDGLVALAAQVLAVQQLTPDVSASDCAVAVSSLLDSLCACGSVVVQCESVLGSDDAGSDETSRLGALQCVRELSPASLGSVVDAEASLFEALKDHLCGSESALSSEERLSCWLSLFLLGCRNGVSVVARVDVLEPLSAALNGSLALLSTAVASGDAHGELRVSSAAVLCSWGLVGWESGAKSLDARAALEKCTINAFKEAIATVAECLTVVSTAEVIARAVELRLLEQSAPEDISVGCGAAHLLALLSTVHPNALLQSDTDALFGGGLSLLKRVCPSPLPAEWWLSTCADVDVTSVRLGLAALFFGVCTKHLDDATLESARWLGPVTAEMVHICKVNASAGLSARPTMSKLAVAYALAMAEQAARVELHAASLLESGVLEALEYACVNDFSYGGMSVANDAAGAVVALVGRNEGGKTLSRTAVNAVLDSFAEFFDSTHWRYAQPASRVMIVVRRVATVAIADVNKKLMIQHDGLLRLLVEGLLLDDGNPRRGQDGADALQEACAGVLHELALYGPGASAMREHKPTMDALRVLVVKSGTKESRERAAGALFELDEEARSAKAKALISEPGSSSKPPPHIMVSYNWDHQHVILRVVAWLQAHGYLVWVDTEQMKGSTVDTMALAVEGSEVMLIGVSRAYKESSNCRMEAQYGLQKKKALIPLKLTQGYEADGWLGLLLGTSLWYALYGATLESESSFEDRMSALSRELGSRGRADAVFVHDVHAPEPCLEPVDEPDALQSELEAMRVTALHKRAVSEGVSADAVDDAMDGDEPKAALINLIVAVSKRGPADRLLSTLQTGGKAAADTLSSALDHALDVLEQLSMSSPRKSRKSILELMESVEVLAESVDEDWCDGVSCCGPARLEALSSRLLAARELQPAGDCVPVVSSLLESLRSCGSVAVQCESVLGADAGSDEAARLGALECVRGLSRASLGRASESEASLFDVLKDHLCGDSESALSCEERLSCWLSLFVLGCRNGLSVVARMDVLEPLWAAMEMSSALLGAAVASGSIEDALCVCSAAHLCSSGLVVMEAPCKSPPDVRAPLEKRSSGLIKSYMGVKAKAHSAESFGKVIAGVVSLKLLEQDREHASLGCGALQVLSDIGLVFPKALAECDTEALHGGALTLLRNVCPSPLPAEWWVSTCAEVDVTSVRLTLAMAFFGSSVGRSNMRSPLLSPALAEAVHICKVNASAGLSARPTMSFCIIYALQLVEVAARVESHAASLLESGVPEALDYACVNDFSYVGQSVASNAAGAVVELVGRNEGGKTLSRATANAVLDNIANLFDPTHYFNRFPAARVLPYLRRVTTMTIADANKKIMLQHNKLLDTLVTGLLLDEDNPRRGQRGADALQEVCAGVLHELALYGPGAAALRAHTPTMDALRVLAESGTKDSRERAAGALFELDEETRAAKTKASDEPDSSKPPPHIMVSYNWDHQHVILRVVAWLQAHGYLVWVDTEQMKGSTVDTMALAVEGSEVMLIGVSRAYKESSNCRMEAQYGLQKKKALIPLMMQEGYEADGWLGLMLGTSLWYALYGSTLESESAFEDRVSALSREIGPRGRADAVVAAAEPGPDHAPQDGFGELRSRLSAMKLSALRKRAKADGVDEQAMEDASDGDNEMGALIELIVARQTNSSPEDSGLKKLRAELGALKLSALRKQAHAAGVDEDAMENAADGSNEKSDIVELLIARKADLVSAADDKPHFGTARTGTDPRSRRTAVSRKHVMLSYQWDQQSTVTRVHDTLTKLGVNCWMDTQGGMGVDIFDSMAAGVAKASCVVCFMSQKYQDSDNCKLELKFAKQSGVEIVPVMAQGGGWRASGWLGLLTAGSLWTRLTDESQFDDSVRQLHEQIQKVVGAADADEEAETVTDEPEVTPDEAKDELERLRDDLGKNESQSAAGPVLADPSQPATIPAGVPNLPAKFQPTTQIAELTRLVLSTSASDLAMHRVGFWGMGGIGKTVTGAAIVRDEGVRAHFDAIVWLPLGQTPVIPKLQSLCYMQCTGKELSSELSGDEKKEALQQALSGKRVLLCLDDLWEEEHEAELSRVDARAGSKVLISTRIQGLLAGGHQVEVGLPSMSDSVRMLMAAADANVESGEPSGVREIVQLCGRLPLALGIAGRLAASLDLVDADDWGGMVGVLKEELRESQSGAGTEAGMIRASLRGLKGSAHEQANVKSLLLLFAFVPEDTHCPLEALLLMYNAIHEGSDATMMHLRKWLRILINRSLVLGKVDRSSVHDLVLDFAVDSFAGDELRAGHRRIVEAFRAARPPDVHGRRGYHLTRVEEPLVAYVCSEAGHHVRTSCRGGSDQHVIGWLADVPQDEIVLAAGRAIGIERVTELAGDAESARDWWLAGRNWSIVRELIYQESGTGAALDPAFKSFDALRLADASTPGHGALRLPQAKTIVLAGAFGDERFHARLSEIDEILASPAAALDPASTAGTRSILAMYMPMLPAFIGDMSEISRFYCRIAQDVRKGAISDPDPSQRLLCGLLLLVGCSFCDIMLCTNTTFWDELYGSDGQALLDAFRLYSYDRHHAFCVKTYNVDGCLWEGLTLITRYGNLNVAEEIIDKSLACLRRSVEADEQATEHTTWLFMGLAHVK